MLVNWRDKNILVLGMGVSGKALSAFLQSQGLCFFIHDDNESKRDLALKEYKNSKPWALEQDKVDLVLYSPGIPLSNPSIQFLKAQGAELLTEVAFALAILKGRVKKIVGITGTNGKSTTTTMLSHVFNQQEIPSLACGNIGVPVTDLLSHKSLPEYLFVELSSYQLEGLNFPCLDAAIMTNLAEDHLDRYQSFSSYIDAKLNIVKALKDKAPFFVEDQAVLLFPSNFEYEELHLFGLKESSYLCYSQRDGRIHQDKVDYILKEEYRNNFLRSRLNALAALCFWTFAKMEIESFFLHLNSFSCLEHRLESLGFFDGVEIINDSKATNVASVLYAMESLPGDIVLIVGGRAKGESFKAWLPYLKTKVSVVFALGEAKEKISKDLNFCDKIVKVKDLKEALDRSVESARKGNKVLLSPGCSSFDMFEDYQERGNVFKSLVRELTCEGKDES
ncbi:UDP-N-acetylmuramoylalanine--D-glutamate ligase [Chlamydiales bacterium SCGC AB-751-O23]|nr:UDP-N-acetylmuramoylalanine--D-glutamate ligase [Chlamydiales bacterium SCGC AB-751-O23]